MWAWLEMQNKTRQAPVYGYEFDRTPPVAPDTRFMASLQALGARHACAMEYVFGTLK